MYSNCPIKIEDDDPRVTRVIMVTEKEAAHCLAALGFFLDHFHASDGESYTQLKLERFVIQ